MARAGGSGIAGNKETVRTDEVRRRRHNDVAVSGLARIPDRVSEHGVKLALANLFLSCLPTVFRDTFFTIGRARAANNAGLRLGTGLILGFAVGGL